MYASVCVSVGRSVSLFVGLCLILSLRVGRLSAQHCIVSTLCLLLCVKHAG